MTYMFRSPPCPGFPVAINFIDVAPEVLADEDAREHHDGAVPASPVWQVFMRRVLPALDCGSARDMAQALLASGTDETAATTHSETMRRRALAAGDVRNARFWDDVTTWIRRP